MQQQPQQVYIVAAKRTPIGSFGGSLSHISGPELAAQAIKGTLKSQNLNPEIIDEVLLGNVCSAGQGQNPARQAALKAGIPQQVPCSNVNKVCASGMKTVMMATQSILAGDSECVLAGGFESMSNIPYYVPNHRKGNLFGHQQLQDGLQFDGLTNVYDKQAMGVCAEKTATDFKITRQENDEYCMKSYERTFDAIKQNLYKNEIIPVVNANGKVVLDADQEPTRYKPEKIAKLRPAFVRQNGTITAANASKINDGASILVLMGERKMKQLNIQPLARIVSYADAEVAPVDFCIAPSESGKKALKKAGLELNQMDYFEFNEAFATTVLANMKLLNVSHDKVNIHGGAVAIGHPLGMSGARIIGALINVLKSKKGKYGMAGICNGGGGGSSIIIENI